MLQYDCNKSTLNTNNIQRPITKKRSKEEGKKLSVRNMKDYFVHLSQKCILLQTNTFI